MTTLIRPLQLGHLPEVARVHAAAFRSSALTALGPEAVRRYYEWLLTGPHQVAAIGAFYGDQLVGFCFGGTFAGAMSGFLRRNRAFLAWRVLSRPSLLSSKIVRRRLATARHAVRNRATAAHDRPPPRTDGPASFAILSIAVHPHHEGHQVGSALMSAMETIARERGFESMHLTVHSENERARRFYERQGWTSAAIHRTSDSLMRKRLT
jgi:ribosomal protein S18 acetylase RimI-like enzyme